MSSRRGPVQRSPVTRPWCLVSVALLGIVLLWLRPVRWRGVITDTEIYQGVWYRCDRLTPDEEGRGLVHIVRIDLAAPGVQLYVTPLDAQAAAQGAQYRLALPMAVLDGNRLAVAVNGTLFNVLGRLPIPGALAKSNETLVSSGAVSHIHAHSYLLWFDGQLMPTLQTTKPPSADALRRARWGISGQGVMLARGQSAPPPGTKRDCQTAIGIDPSRRLLWLMVFENASSRAAARAMAAAGATDAILVDSGDSSCMVIGAAASHADAGAVHGGYRPVATCFGVTARPVVGAP